MTLEPCYYCGKPADSIDHVVPKSLLASFRGNPEMLGVLTARRKLLEVPACRECNSLLGASYQPNAEQRKQALKTKLRRKYKKELATPEWANTELEELGHGLQQYIKASIAVKDYVKERLEW